LSRFYLDIKLQDMLTASKELWGEGDQPVVVGQVVFVLLFFRLVGLCRLTLIAVTVVLTLSHAQLLPHPNIPPLFCIQQLTNTDTGSYNDNLTVFPERQVFAFIWRAFIFLCIALVIP
jgi:hypothetical protein